MRLAQSLCNGLDRPTELYLELEYELMLASEAFSYLAAAGQPATAEKLKAEGYVSLPSPTQR